MGYGTSRLAIIAAIDLHMTRLFCNKEAAGISVQQGLETLQGDTLLYQQVLYSIPE